HGVGVAGVVPDLGAGVDVEDERHALLLDVQLEQPPQLVGVDVLRVGGAVAVVPLAVGVGDVLGVAGGQDALLVADVQVDAAGAALGAARLLRLLLHDRGGRPGVAVAPPVLTLARGVVLPLPVGGLLAGGLVVLGQRPLDQVAVLDRPP